MANELDEVSGPVNSAGQDHIDQSQDVQGKPESRLGAFFRHAKRTTTPEPVPETKSVEERKAIQERARGTFFN
jgi:hypothetical protein